ncbi:DUF2637 domain-containing protein [Streptomyces sp. B1866]|uniref:DUF2637 domain-containing protein n=1 Tax=Streptomyces sp. B1866 TaxID=3075431 RepID=UPI00289099B3|nr:DUF2637 domain-containing protein [Streptomyces sp. B1866]MDT3395763.1 DUF2637 domain-containing protein [Streptomyces sp. B1866]
MSRRPKVLLVVALVGVVALAFRVSWNALRDIARAIGADPTAATLYPFVVDGLMALALTAALTLTGDDRRFALRVLAGYTAASLVLNYVHGMVPALHEPTGGRVRLADWAPAHWALVLLATSLPVGSIFFGSDLVAKVLHHQPATPEPYDMRAERSVGELEESAPATTAPVPGPAPVQSAEPDPTGTPATDPQPEPESGPESTGVPVGSVAASAARPRRATGRVPHAARTPRPVRTPEELLEQARAATAAWSDGELTADAIRTAVRTSAARARTLRDALRAERAERAAAGGSEAVPGGLRLVGGEG